MKSIINKIVDNGDFFEVHSKFARNLIVGFARLGGQGVGIVAQQPAFNAGVIDVDASDKGARFVTVLRLFQYPRDYSR